MRYADLISAMKEKQCGMNHIRQRNDIDCGIAASAMLAGTSYTTALACDPAPETERGYSVADMIEALSRLGVRASVSRAGYGRSLRDRSPTGPAIVLIRRPGDRTGHWIAWDGNYALDPERSRPKPIRSYDRADWVVVRTITVAAPARAGCSPDCPRALPCLGRPVRRRVRHARERRAR